MQHLRPALTMLLLLTALTGVAYPLAVTTIGQLLFAQQANGSLIVRDGQARGSQLIGQPFSDPRYFWSRPSATGPFPYNSAASSGSNLGPLSDALRTAVQERIAALRTADAGNSAPIPIDLVTASASGLDPHISPAAAAYQSARVARARGLEPKVVEELIANYTSGRQWGVLGEPRVNVLELNLALDALPAR